MIHIPPTRRLGDGSVLRYWLCSDGKVRGQITSKGGRRGAPFVYQGGPRE